VRLNRQQQGYGHYVMPLLADGLRTPSFSDNAAQLQLHRVVSYMQGRAPQ